MEKLQKYIIGANASIFQKIDPDSNVKVFVPENEEGIKAAIAFARENNLPITSKGGGSGMSGACTGASRKKVIISSMRMKKVLEINFDEGYAVVEAGITPDELNAEIQQRKPNWKFFVAPSSRDIATVGGILSTDGGGNDAWLAGTMADNVLEVELFDYHGNKIIVTKIDNDNKKARITCSDKELQEKLQKSNFSIIDIAGAHGTLGYISKLKLLIKPLSEYNNQRYALAHAGNLNALGKIIYELIEANIPLTYGEAIVEARHPEISGKTNPPMLILEFPADFQEKVQTICKSIPDVNFNSVNKEEFEQKKEIRIKMAKRNPPEGYQLALFEGYGIAGDNLLRFEELVRKINQTLESCGFEPFIKFGHAPSVYHHGDEKIKGIIMHSREKRPEELTSKMVFDGIVALVELCEKEGIIPKPEHKWPFSKTTQKHKRLTELTTILGKKFNPFILDSTLKELAELVL
ncbi:MAG: FAD-binding protein [Candidatus Heimdallarchaeota archaeon]|nr:FAD-binding protein [Candidatus Heimdallarchaeota archaeon]